MYSSIAIILLVMAGISYWVAPRLALKKASLLGVKIGTLPSYYGMYSAIIIALPALCFLLLWAVFSPVFIQALVYDEALAVQQEYGFAAIDLSHQLMLAYMNAPENITDVRDTLEIAVARYHYLEAMLSSLFVAFMVMVVSVGLYVSVKHNKAGFNVRDRLEKWLIAIIAVASIISILTTIGIVLSLLFETIRFFQQVSMVDFLFGLKWSPQIAIRDDQVGSSGAFGAIPVFAGTFLISLVAMCVATPLGLLSAIYLSEYASRKFRDFAKPILEILAGIPTVVYGFFAILTVAPFLKDMGVALNLDVSSESALAAGLVMGIMLIPFISSLSDDVISAVPQSLRDGSYGLGATKSETIIRVLLPAALPGIAGALLLAVSRAIGETMIVVMAAGMAANLTVNPLQAVTTVTVQIVTLLVGDQEFDNAKTLAAFALGLMLFVMTLALNIIALLIVRRFREQYD